MERMRIITIILLLYFSITAYGQPAQKICRPVDDALLYYYIDPMIFRRGDTSTTMTIEVVTAGLNITRVYLENPEEIILVDDGTNGDRVAGDGIYTASNVPPHVESTTLNFGTHSTGGPDVFVEKTDGSTESDFLRFGVVAEDQNFPAIELAEGLFATQYAFFIEDPEGTVLDSEEWPVGRVRCARQNFEATQKLYSVLPDNFDFVIVMPAHTMFHPDRNYAENTPYFVRAKNDIQHIGIDLFDNTSDFGSAGRLKGMIYHSWGYGAILDHEIGHAWCADLGESLSLCKCENSFGNHWNPLSDIGGQMGAFLSHDDFPQRAGHLKDNGNGTWRLERNSDDNDPYSNLALYAMGLIPFSEVPPVHILVNPDLTDYTSIIPESVITYTIDEIITAEGGERIPSYEDSQKEFNVAFIVVKNKAFTAEEYAFYSLVSKYFASQQQGRLSLTTFYHATGGRGTLNPDLGVVSSVESEKCTYLRFLLYQNYPNPFNPETRLIYDIHENAYVRIGIYNIYGQKVADLIDNMQNAGSYQITWEARDLPSGTYIIRMQAGEFVQMRKCILMK